MTNGQFLETKENKETKNNMAIRSEQCVCSFWKKERERERNEVAATMVMKRFPKINDQSNQTGGDYIVSE